MVLFLFLSKTLELVAECPSELDGIETAPRGRPLTFRWEPNLVPP